MVQIVLNDDQLEIVRRSSEPGELVDRAGLRVGQFTPSEPNREGADPDFELALKRMEEAKRGEGSYRTSQQVFDRLRSLGQS